ncbi:hypothetical protein GQ457_14G015920 [Hibiscus cannabinus]
MEMDQAQLVYCSFGIDFQCFYFFYIGALIFCFSWMTKGMSQLETNGSGLGRLSRLGSDLGRASCRVIGLCLSPNNYSACLYTIPSTVELSPLAIRCRKVPFLTRRN